MYIQVLVGLDCFDLYKDYDLAAAEYVQFTTVKEGDTLGHFE